MSITPEAAANIARMTAAVDMQWVNNIDTQRAIDQAERNNRNAMSGQRNYYESEIARLQDYITQAEFATKAQVGEVEHSKLLVEHKLVTTERDLALTKSDLAAAERDLALAKRDLLDFQQKLNMLDFDKKVVEARNHYLQDEKRDVEIDKSLQESISNRLDQQVRDKDRIMTLAKMSSYVYAEQVDNLVAALKSELDSGETLSHASIERIQQKVQADQEAELTPLVESVTKKLKARRMQPPEGEAFLDKVNAKPMALNMGAMMDKLQSDLLTYSTKTIAEERASIAERANTNAEKYRVRNESLEAAIVKAHTPLRPS